MKNNVAKAKNSQQARKIFITFPEADTNELTAFILLVSKYIGRIIDWYHANAQNIVE
jgi:hypothetical protein